MAGGYEPWRMNSLMFTRIMSEAYPPKITMYDLWKNSRGQVKRENRVTLSNLNYLSMVGAKEYSTQDPLRFEKAMLKLWFSQTFVSDSRPAPAMGKP